MDKNTNKISIIVPVHNAAKTLHTCVESILSQNYDPLECILVENNSTDNSVELCKHYADKYSWIKTVISADKGVSNARNLGLSLATGDIIGFVDADDVLEPNALQCIANEFKYNPDIIAVIGAFFVGRTMEGQIRKVYKGLKYQKISPIEAIVLTVGNNAVMGSVWNKYYRSDVLKNIFFDSELSYCEDMHFNVKVLSSIQKENKILLTDSPLYCYMINEASVTHQLDRLYDANGDLKYVVAMKKILSDCSLNKRCRSIVKRNIACLALDYCWNGIGSEAQIRQLKKEIRRNYIYVLRNVIHFGFAENIKVMIKSVCVLCGITRHRVV